MIAPEPSGKENYKEVVFCCCCSSSSWIIDQSWTPVFTNRWNMLHFFFLELFDFFCFTQGMYKVKSIFFLPFLSHLAAKIWKKISWRFHFSIDIKDAVVFEQKRSSFLSTPNQHQKISQRRILGIQQFAEIYLWFTDVPSYHFTRVLYAIKRGATSFGCRIAGCPPTNKMVISKFYLLLRVTVTSARQATQALLIAHRGRRLLLSFQVTPCCSPLVMWQWQVRLPPPPSDDGMKSTILFFYSKL